MFNFCRREPERPNYAKIFAITVAVVAAASTLALITVKLFNKYFCIAEGDDEDFLDDGCDDCDVCVEEETEDAEDTAEVDTAEDK